MSRRVKGIGVWSLVAVLIVFGIAVHEAYAGPEESGIIKIGAIVSLTGPAGVYGLSIQCALKAYEELVNDRGGITVKGKKYKIKTVCADDKLSLAGARAAAEKLLYTDKVDFFVGSFSGHMVRAWAPLVMKEKKVAVIGGPAVQPKPDWPYLFHVSSNERTRSQALCNLVKEKFDSKSIAYIFSDSADGKLAKKLALEDEKARGLEIKGIHFTSSFTKDFYPLLTQALKSNPDFLFVQLVPGPAALVIKQARELGYKGLIGNAIVMPGNLKQWQNIAGLEASKGFIAIMGDISDRSESGVQMNKYFGNICPQYRSSDIAYVLQPDILLMAIEEAQSFDSDKICTVLKTKEFHSLLKIPTKASGEKTFGIKHHMDVPVPYSMVVGKDQVKFLGSVNVITP